MSVYTQLSQPDFDSILSNYDLGKLIAFEGIAAGIENTNYKLTLEKAGITQFYFLTIFEEISQSDLDFFMPLLAHLKEQNNLLAAPIKNIHGQLLFTAKEKNGALLHCLEGGHLNKITPEHCYIIGQELAQIHLNAKDFGQSHDNNRGFYWLQKQIQNTAQNREKDDSDLMLSELTHLQTCWVNWQNLALPKGFIHADLFPDNSLFKGDNKTQLSGIIDFYAGGQDYWVYDLAITIMAWCQTDSAIDTKLKASMLAGYQNVRPLETAEQDTLPDFLRLAVLRFWMSRLISQATQENATLTTFKDPNEMKALLLSLGLFTHPF